MREHRCLSEYGGWGGRLGENGALAGGLGKTMREQHEPTNEQLATHPLSASSNKGRFGNYDLVRRIDVGGMGEVYLARQRTAFGREVAVKIIRSDLMHDLTARARFLREAEVSAHLKHEHILPLV